MFIGIRRRLLCLVFACLAFDAAADDGRLGSLTMNGRALDLALVELNSHLAMRNAVRETLVHLDVVPKRRLADRVRPRKTITYLRPGSRMGAFGPMVDDDATLMVTLATFEDARRLRGDNMFLKVSQMPPRSLPPMESVAGVIHSASIGGAIRNDQSLESRMRALSGTLRRFKARARRTNPTSTIVTDHSFDVWGAALVLLN